MKKTEIKMDCGDEVKDSITGFTGVVICRSVWLNGCVRLAVQPRKLENGKPTEAQHFDVEQLILVKAAKPAAVEPSGGPKPSPVRHPNPHR